jgi:hypothetical protein
VERSAGRRKQPPRLATRHDSSVAGWPSRTLVGDARPTAPTLPPPAATTKSPRAAACWRSRRAPTATGPRACRRGNQLGHTALRAERGGTQPRRGWRQCVTVELRPGRPTPGASWGRPAGGRRCGVAGWRRGQLLGLRLGGLTAEGAPEPSSRSPTPPRHPLLAHDRPGLRGGPGVQRTLRGLGRQLLQKAVS